MEQFEQAAVQVLLNAAQYAVNRLDAAKSQSQVSADLAVAIAVVKTYTKLTPEFK